MNCATCGKRVVLQPTAKERAVRYGGKPEDYTRLFPRHAECALKERAAGVSELIKRSAQCV